MKRILPLIVAFAMLVNAVKVFAGGKNDSYRALFNKTMEHYTAHNGFDFNAIYKNKCFDCDSFQLFQYHVSLINNSKDTIFGCYFYYDVLHEGQLIYKLYDGRFLYLLDTKEKKSIAFDVAEGQTSPVTGAIDGMIIQINGAFQPDKLRKLFFGGKPGTSFSDTTIENVSYVCCKTKFADDGDFTDIYRMVFVNRKTQWIDRILTHAAYDDQTEIRDIVYQNFQVKKMDLKQLDSSYATHKTDDISDVSFRPHQIDSLPLGGNVPLIKVGSYPENRADSIPRKGKIALLDFWYTACMPCVKTIPDINKLFEKYKDKVDFYGVNASADDRKHPRRVVDFQSRTPIQYPVVFADEDVLQSLKINGFPTLYIIDPKGNLAYKILGFDESADLYKLLDDALSALLQ